MKHEDIIVTGPGQPTDKSFKESLPATPTLSEGDEYLENLKVLYDLKQGRRPACLGAAALRAEAQQTDAIGRVSNQRLRITPAFVEALIIPGM